MDIKEELYNVADMAKYLGVCQETIFRQVRKGSIPYVRIFGSIRFRPADIEEWVRKGAVGKR